MPEPGPILTVSAASCRFDVSPPALTRLLAHEPRRILRAVENVSFYRRARHNLQHRRQIRLREIDTGDAWSSACRGRPRARCVSMISAAAMAASARRAVQMIFQDPYASLNPRWRVGGRHRRADPRTEAAARPRPRSAERVGDLLEIVGLSRADAERYPHAFSGGQRQRISIARALATEADFLVCDEPTSALDVSVQAQILNLMVRLQKEFGLTYLFISHNLSVVRHMSDQLAIMYLGRFVESGPAEAIFQRPRHPYTRLLLDTIPDVERPNRGRRPMSGEVPSPIAPPPGCAFHPRCPIAVPDCSTAAPVLRALDERLVACHRAA